MTVFQMSDWGQKPRLQDILLSTAEHKIKTKWPQSIEFYGYDSKSKSFILLIIVKMLIIVGILTFYEQANFVIL